jgi:hypothetical protein
MAVGLSTVNYADKVLNHMHRAVASTAPVANYVKLHTADPGASAANAASANATRVAVTFGASASGVVTSSNTPSWATWAAGNETITHISVWDASTAGTFLYSVALTVSKAVTNGDTLNLTSLTAALTPLAA